MILPAIGKPLTEFDLVEIENAALRLVPTVENRIRQMENAGDYSGLLKLFEGVRDVLDLVPQLIRDLRGKGV